jgi:hypothetical protein
MKRPSLIALHLLRLLGPYSADSSEADARLRQLANNGYVGRKPGAVLNLNLVPNAGVTGADLRHGLTRMANSRNNPKRVDHCRPDLVGHAAFP